MGHLASYARNPRVELAALCDHDADWLAYVAKEYHPKKTYLTYGEMVADPEIDAVSVCLPNSFHAVASVAALKAGKHVLCEKPMAVTVGEAKSMEEASLASGKKLMISHQQRFENNVAFLKANADAGVFGKIYHIRITWRRPHGMMPLPNTVRANGGVYSRNWFNEKDNGGGVLRDLGTHLIDLAMYMTGFPAMLDASGSLGRHFYPEGFENGEYVFDSEDTAVAHIRFEGGLSVSLDVCFASYTGNEVVSLEIYGTKGGASRVNGDVRVYSNYGAADTASNVIRYANKEKTSQEHFTDAILNDTPVPIPGREGVAVIRVLDAIYKSAENKS